MSYIQRVDGPTKGSLSQVAEEKGITVEQAFANAEIVVVIDQSGSMCAPDARDGRERFDVAEEELRKIQEAYPGAVAVFEFSDDIRFCPDGVPTRIGRMTNLTDALRYVKQADNLYEIVVISDGEPDNEYTAMDVARTFKGPIHTIFIGEEGNQGQDFLRKLAQATGGRQFQADKPGELMPGVVALLTG